MILNDFVLFHMNLSQIYPCNLAYEQEFQSFIATKKKELKNISNGLFSIMLVTIMYDGTISDASVYLSSDNDELDKYYVDFLKNLGKFKPLPNNKKGLKCYVPFESQNKPDNIENVNFKPYLTQMQNIIKSNWNRLLTVHDKSYRTVVVFRLNKDGEIPRSVVLKSSGNEKFDAEALHALRTSKLKPLPKEFSGKGIDVMFTFDCYNLH